VTNPPGTIVAVDVETTSVRPDRRAWDIGLIRRTPDGVETTFQAFIAGVDLDLGNADHRALQVGRFHQRHPDYRRQPDLFYAPGVDQSPAPREYDVWRQVEWLTRGAELVGYNVAFDAATLDSCMRANGISPSFGYHLIEVRSLLAGFLRGAGAWTLDDFGTKPAGDLRAMMAAVDMPEPAADVRHTALGDARMALDLYDAVMRGGNVFDAADPAEIAAWTPPDPKVFERVDAEAAAGVVHLPTATITPPPPPGLRTYPHPFIQAPDAEPGWCGHVYTATGEQFTPSTQMRCGRHQRDLIHDQHPGS
jgi:DNA polymerase III epsilon subunit-like protein